jgi:D-glycero-alpha-D-manno-heptose 1-phosphate guanylyltransferase
MLDAIILCGGRGTRLASVIADVPKPLAPVSQRPFLDYLLAFLSRSGAVRSATLAVHHLADRIVSYYADHAASFPLRIVKEDKPLGTGGAMMNCLGAVDGPTFLCLNGDSICGGDLAALVEAHRAAAPGFTLGLVELPDTSRYGRAICDNSGRIVEFAEKAPSLGAGLVNAGVYVIDREVLEPWNGEALSMERDILPRLVRDGRVRGVRMSGPFIDIGLPETYAAAADFVGRLGVGQAPDWLERGNLHSF